MKSPDNVGKGCIGSGACEIICYQVFMNEPSQRTSRLALAGGIAAVMIIGGGGFLLGRTTSERAVVVTPAAPVKTPTASVAPERKIDTEAVLGRADLIDIAAAASDAVAAGRALPAAVLKADGRRFQILLPFGCEGSAAQDSGAPMRWRYDAKDKALRIHAAPVSWAVRDWWPEAEEGPDNIEAIEGFWINRPWTSSETCPAARPMPATGTDTIMLPGQTLAIAQFFAADSARQGRRDGKAFETVTKAEPDRVPGTQGFRLRITGRIANIPGGAPALCRQPAGPEQRPICILGTVVDEVAIENPVSGETLATWNTDRKNGDAGR